MGKKVAILGATGAVGQEMLKILDERDFPIDELRLLTGPNSAGKTVDFRGEQIVCRQAGEGAFDGMDIVLGAAENDVAREMWPHIKASGALFIDNSSEFRLDPEVPLVVPEVNGDDAFEHHGLIANPNCVTIISLMALKPISDISPIQTLVASSYQAVSGAGVAGMRELDAQVKAYAAGEEQPFAHKTFAKQIAFNLIPKIGGVGTNGYSSEEMKLQNEG
ncbi:MAG: aspartate-semialdehyde dehydrogenase, partial [Firmicutes bacterium]|nr:aspartate-semialdehyde dehydrogenase [Bacillota bacterium]